MEGCAVEAASVAPPGGALGAALAESGGIAAGGGAAGVAKVAGGDAGVRRARGCLRRGGYHRRRRCTDGLLRFAAAEVIVPALLFALATAPLAEPTCSSCQARAGFAQSWGYQPAALIWFPLRPRCRHGGRQSSSRACEDKQAGKTAEHDPPSARAAALVRQYPPWRPLCCCSRLSLRAPGRQSSLLSARSTRAASRNAGRRSEFHNYDVRVTAPPDCAFAYGGLVAPGARIYGERSIRSYEIPQRPSGARARVR